MKKFLFFSTFLFLITHNAFADNTAVANSGSLSNSTAIGAAQANNVGNAGASVEMNYTNTGSAIPVGTPGFLNVAIPSPQIFVANPYAGPNNIAGITADDYLNSKCKPVYTKNGRSKVDVKSGATRNTQIVFTSYPDYQKYKYTNGSPEKVLPYFPAVSGNYICIGTLMITADNSPAAEAVVNGRVLGSDTENYVFDNIEGYSEVYFICPMSASGTGVGSNTTGNGFALGGAAAGLAGGNPAAAVLLALAASYQQSKASTHNSAQNGKNCWILGKPKNPEVGVPFKEGEYEEFLLAQAAEHVKRMEKLQPANGDGPKKYEVTK